MIISNAQREGGHNSQWLIGLTLPYFIELIASFHLDNLRQYNECKSMNHWRNESHVDIKTEKGIHYSD
jgi:hypothetical protein